MWNIDKNTNMCSIKYLFSTDILAPLCSTKVLPEALLTGQVIVRSMICNTSQTMDNLFQKLEFSPEVLLGPRNLNFEGKPSQKVRAIAERNVSTKY